MSDSQTVQILAFDIYGTLLDTSAISKALEKHARLEPSKAGAVSTLWRRYQLEYTWRLNSMKIYEPWNEVTRNSLLHAAAESGVVLDDSTVEKLMEAYSNLDSFPDAKPALNALNKLRTTKTLVFSNGTQAMVQMALQAGSIDKLPSGMYVADSVKIYKPAPEIYQGLVKHAGKAGSPHQCWLVSGNPFDVTGARSVGMNAIWVDRARKGWTDKAAGGPTKIVHSLEEIAPFMQSLNAKL